MAFKKKEWKDRLSEFAGRRRLVDVDTGEERVVDVTRDEGLVSQAGDAFSALNMNDLEERIEIAISAGSESNESLSKEVENVSKSTQALSNTVSGIRTKLDTTASTVNTIKSQLGSWKISVIPLSQYNSLSQKDTNTLYFCYD